MKNKVISNFWNWIKDNIDNLKPKALTKEYIDLLDTKIQELGDFSWEIGFDNREKNNFLVISPEGDPELLEKSRAILNEAPKIDN